MPIQLPKQAIHDGLKSGHIIEDDGKYYTSGLEVLAIKIIKEPVNLFEGDQRLQTLFDAIQDMIYERGKGLPIPSIVGVLELVKHGIIGDANG